MIDDYDHLNFHMHLFVGQSDILLSKLDSIYDHVIYDDCLIGVDESSTYELHTIAGALGLFPITFLASFFNSELPQANTDMTNFEINGPFGESLAPLAVIVCFAFLYTLRPYFLHKLVFNTSPFNYFSINMLCYFAVLMTSVIFVEISGNISSTKSVALIISAFAYFLFYNVSEQSIRA